MKLIEEVSMAELIEYSVSEISFAIKKCVETTFNQVRVKGEIFGAKRADSGHWYLALKDANAVLSAVCWKGVASALNVKIEDGLEVVATGKITTFVGKSSYQLVIERLEIAGTGALLKLLEERKQQFLKEGLFDASHKKEIPFLPKVIGVVTSASGAVIRDIIHRVRDRFPSHIIVWPTPVQGEGAAEKIAAAIRGFNLLPTNNIERPDVLIVARGGGSLEDLWPFNEEVVVRAVYDSQIPIISAVGHETDTMLIDYVADKRAPTPTGAAEFAVPVKEEISLALSVLESRYLNAMYRLIKEHKNLIEGLGRGIPNLEQIVLENQQRLDDRTERLKASFANYFNVKEQLLNVIGLKPYLINNLLEKHKINLTSFSTRLASVSIESVLKRGFAWVTDSHFKTLYDTSHAKRSGELNIRFVDGIVKTKVVENRDAEQFDLFDL
ncbi:MAG: exodeoxyribonuclease VII large subunit [Alphaproteobacteria bacterium]|nr:exodeoxyribonuclease VII large subunit [Alphaproteobacteria bacterium]